MSRFRYAAQAFVSGYVAIAANLLYTLASVPLALHYLSKPEFGMWALIMQIAGYFGLIDFGMSGAVARILADHKDDRDGGSYGAVLKTGALVFSVQGVLIAILGVALSWILPALMGIPANLRTLFIILMAAQCFLLGAGFCVKILGSALWCHQRSDVVNISSVLMLGISFAVLWLGFHFGLGLYSMLISNAAGVLTNALASWLASSWLKLFPTRGFWGAVSWNVFWEVYDYAKNLFLITIGTQLLMASQVVIVTRVLGLDAAAVWSIATKVFTLAQQVVFRIFDFSIAALVEMFVRGERALLQKRLRHLVLFTASLSIAVGATVAVSNSSFLEIWTRGRIAWGWQNDVLMAALLVLYSVVRCYCSLMDVTKELRVLKYVSLFEGICFVVLAMFLATKFGFSGVIGAAIVLDIFFMGTYGAWKTAKLFHVSVKAILWDWLLPAWRMAVVLLPIAALVWWLTRDLPPWQRFLSCAGVTGSSALVFLFSIGVTRDIRDELFTRMRAILPSTVLRP